MDERRREQRSAAGRKGAEARWAGHVKQGPTFKRYTTREWAERTGRASCHVYLKQTTWEELRVAAEERGTSRAKLIRSLIEEFLEEQGRKGGNSRGWEEKE